MENYTGTDSIKLCSGASSKDKLVVEEKYVIDYPIDELKTEPDKLYNSTTKAVRESKRSRKSLITKNIFYGKRKVFQRIAVHY
jgi:hypothetical protein